MLILQLGTLAQAATGLYRHGFVNAASGYGALVYFATERSIQYLEHIDLSVLEIRKTR